VVNIFVLTTVLNTLHKLGGHSLEVRRPYRPQLGRHQRGVSTACKSGSCPLSNELDRKSSVTVAIETTFEQMLLVFWGQLEVGGTSSNTVGRVAAHKLGGRAPNF